MNTSIFRNWLCRAGAIFILTMLLMRGGSLLAQTTAFTYQGQLIENGALVSGYYDLTFSLYDNLAGGTQQGSTITMPAVPISSGLFNVTLDFGSGSTIFPGTRRWLEITSKTNGGPTYSALVPRQEITSAPYAITAGKVTGFVNASQISGAIGSSQIANGSIVDADISATAAIADTKLATIQTPGKVSDLALSANVALLDGNPQTFSGTNTFSKPVRTSDGFYIAATSNVARLVKEAYGGRLYLQDENGVDTGIFGSSTAAGGFLDINQANSLVLGINLDGDATGNRGGGLLEVMNTNGTASVTLSGSFNGSNRGQIKTEDLVMTPSATTNVLASGATLVPVNGYVRVAGSGGNISLSATTAIASGSTTGSLLILQGTSDSATVTVPNNANTAISASRVLGLNDTLTLIWNGNQWVQLAFSNN